MFCFLQCGLYFERGAFAFLLEQRTTSADSRSTYRKLLAFHENKRCESISFSCKLVFYTVLAPNGESIGKSIP